MLQLTLETFGGHGLTDRRIQSQLTAAKLDVCMSNFVFSLVATESCLRKVVRLAFIRGHCPLNVPDAL